MNKHFFISIHALREEGDKYWMQGREPEFNFYPRPPRGGRRPWLIRFTMQSYFYPRPPRGGRRGIKGGIAKGGVFLSTPSARRATPVMLATPDRSTISIHALREEGDRMTELKDSRFTISIHALREEGDIGSGEVLAPTPNFYPRPPRGGRPRGSRRNNKMGDFYPRPPRGGRPAVAGHRPLDERISIHALREEGDATGCLCVSVSHNFYPRPPRGGRRNLLASLADGILFLSTPSARRATWGRLPR